MGQGGDPDPPSPDAGVRGTGGGRGVFLQPLLSYNALSLSEPRGGAPTARDGPIHPGGSSGSPESHETPRGDQHLGVSLIPVIWECGADPAPVRSGLGGGKRKLTLYQQLEGVESITPDPTAGRGSLTLQPGQDEAPRCRTNPAAGGARAGVSVPVHITDKC